MITTTARRAVIAACSLMSTIGAVATTANAGAPLWEYSCHELWMERNGIYANRGYCFQTAKAKAVFGKGCFAPYGALNGAEAKKVQSIRKWETIKGC